MREFTVWLKPMTRAHSQGGGHIANMHRCCYMFANMQKDVVHTLAVERHRHALDCS